VHQTNATLEALRQRHAEEGGPRLAEARQVFLERWSAGGDVEGVDVEEYLRVFGPGAQVGWKRMHVMYLVAWEVGQIGVGQELVSDSSPPRPHTNQERQALLSHECQRLKGLVLPPPARFWLWLAQQPDAFFNAAMEGGGLPSPSSSSASGSAQASAVPAPAPSAAKAGERMMQEGAQSCGVGAELWPLLCFELQLKAEQEQAVAAGCVRVFRAWVVVCCGVVGWAV
jgi:hypothetical protein